MRYDTGQRIAQEIVAAVDVRDDVGQAHRGLHSRRGTAVNDVQPFAPGTAACSGGRVEIGGVVAYLPGMIQRVSTIAGWLALAFIVYATLSPIDDRPVLATPHFEHFAAFALVGLAFGLAYPRRLVLIAALVLISAFGLEAMQLLTPDRHGRLIDAVIKAAGGVCGIGISQLGLMVLRAQTSRAS